MLAIRHIVQITHRLTEFGHIVAAFAVDGESQDVAEASRILVDDRAVLVCDFEAAFLTPCIIVPSERNGGSDGHIARIGGQTTVLYSHLLGRRAISVFHFQIVVFPTIIKGIVQGEDDFAGISVVDCQHCMPSIDIHKVEAEGNGHNIRGGSR